MKQHITTKQLNELNEKGKKKLREWAMTRDLIVIAANKYLPTLSIGQMIEFLDDSGHTLYSINTVEKDGERIKFMVTFRDASFKHAISGYRPELADALWEAVKEVLEK